MAIERDLKIFISWSGDLAKEVTKVLRAWLPKMFDHIDPWASEVDIDAGTRGLDAIQERLNQSSFGIIVVTTENMAKPWLNFEAGALSRRLDADLTRVVPLLVNFEDVYQLQGPISQFQATRLNKEGMSNLCRSLASAIGLDPLTITSRFEWAWSDLEDGIAHAKALVGHQPPAPELDEKDLLKTLVQSVKTMQRQINDLSAGKTQSTPSTPKKRLVLGNPMGSPWHDHAKMQQCQEDIKRIASEFKPVRSVEPIEREGNRYVGVIFEDGLSLDKGQHNWFLEQMMKMPVSVVVLTDDGAMDLGPK
ncbi:toll/interleukin-1 receptor domain-containing protein [Mycobacterium sp. MBM]|nr:toll/interleukin-1 receptor domain-containing protein [Mycobacterium sp. MBM]